MVFSSILFMFRFLPIVLLLYFVAPKQIRNAVLFIASLIFYAWGEPVYVVLMLFSTIVDYTHGRLVYKYKQKGEIKKEYAAVVLGVPSPEKGIIDAPITRCDDSIIKRKVSADGKSAVTEYESDFTRSDKKYTLVRAFPITGRTHQIRLHLSHLGYPIYGDFLYGEPIDGVRAYLHCTSLIFNHPMTGEKLKIEAPLPDDIKEIMQI